MKILLLLMFLCLPVFACEQAEKNENFKYELSKIENDSGYFGVYQSPNSSSRGKRVYIFPDKSFAIVGFCDICMGEDLLTKGKFEFSESKIILVFEIPYNGRKSLAYYLRTGSKHFDNYIEGNDSLMLEEQQLRNFSYKENFYSVLHNIEPYPDWQTKSQEFKQKGVQKK